MAYVYWFITQGERWLEQVMPYLPQLGVVTDQEALRNFYLGHSTLYTMQHIRAWAPAVGVWLAYIFVGFFVMLCISVILHHQWSQHERLAYPITQFPLAITSVDTPIWRNRILWLGFAGAASVEIWNGISRIVPSLPYLPFTLQMLSPPPNPPWNAIAYIHLSLYP